MAEKQTGEKPDVITVDILFSLQIRDYAGHYLTRFYRGLRDEGKIWANKCPNCGCIILPPRIMCVFCKTGVEDVEENWVQLPDTGTVAFPTAIPAVEMDWRTNEPIGTTAMANAFIRIDGGDEWTILGHLVKGFTVADEPPMGLPVRAVWKPKEERTGKISDIMYFEPYEK